MGAQKPDRTDIQVLRGIAVLAVIMHHFGGLLPSGFLGVDVFFVISGFVITLSLKHLVELNLTTWDRLRIFWRRRIWRLMPALSVVLTTVLLAGLAILPPRQFWELLEMALWSFFFAGNIGVEVLATPDYFDPAAENNWLLHLWSLGVEEQFYLVFPLLIIGFSLLQRRRAIPIILIIAMASFVLAALNDLEAAFSGDSQLTDTTGISAILGYYSPFTRAWQFLVGVLAAVIFRRPSNRPARRVIRIAGSGLILGSFILLPSSGLLPGPTTLVPVFGVFLLLVYPIRNRAYKSPIVTPFAWLGDRSYSAYLWHWPVWVVATQFIEDTFPALLAGLALTLFLADRTFALVEEPLRGLGTRNLHRRASSSIPTPKRKSRKLGAFAILVSPLVIVGGIVGSEKAIAEKFHLQDPVFVPRISSEANCLQTPCDSQEVDVLLVGDSHAGSISSFLLEELSQSGLSLKGAITARPIGCPHLLSKSITSEYKECVDLALRAVETIQHTQPKWVVIFGYTSGRFTTTNSGGEQKISLKWAATGKPVLESDAGEAYALALSETISVATTAGAKVLLVSGAPDFRLRPEEAGRNGEPVSMLEYLISPWTGLKQGDLVSRKDFLLRNSTFRSVERALALNEPRLTLVDPWPILCQASYCSQRDEKGNLLYADQDHLSDFGASLIADAVAQKIY